MKQTKYIQIILIAFIKSALVSICASSKVELTYMLLSRIATPISEPVCS